MQKKILLAPLNWGLGHATRCIPLIQELLLRNCEVQVASDGMALAFLKMEFPSLKFWELPSYSARYSHSANSMLWKMISQLPKFIGTIAKENIETERIVTSEKIDVVISDNRYGCYSSEIKSIFLSHQLNIQMPEGWGWVQQKLNSIHHLQIKKFDECWIPSVESSLFPQFFSLHKIFNSKFIGYLSRLKSKPADIRYNAVALSSGPSPQKQLFNEMIRKEFRKSASRKYFLVCGEVESQRRFYEHGKFGEVNFLDSGRLNDLILQSEIIIARSGYSTVMDLMETSKRAIFVPTPGQTEQDYIAAELMKQGIAFSMSQDKFDLSSALQQSEKFSGFRNFDTNKIHLQKAIDSIL